MTNLWDQVAAVIGLAGDPPVVLISNDVPSDLGSPLDYAHWHYGLHRD
jgi:hypothetical protein